MKHTNTGSSGHTNTGYTNHTNTYANHTNTYNNHTNTYGNHTNAPHHSNSYFHLSKKEKNKINEEYNPYEDIDFTIYENNNHEIMPLSNSSYGAASYHSDYSKHANTGTNHVNTGSGGNNHNQYNQTGSGGNNHKQYTQSGYNNHTNTGYSNHTNTNTNKEPGQISNINLGTLAYYKDNVKLVWSAAPDNNKCISCISASFGSSANVGIFEQDVKKVATSRGVAVGYWNSSGVWTNSIHRDTYGSEATMNEIISFINGIPAGSYLAVSTWDAISDGQLGTFKSKMVAMGASSANSLEGSRSAFAGIFKVNTQGSSFSCLAQTSHRYGSNPVSAGVVSAQYTISGVSSGQTLKYIIEYAFKPIGSSSYGSWTSLGQTTSLEYTYNLANHGNGFIKFRILVNDGLENSTSYVESKEIRILKYNAPELNIAGQNNLLKATDFNTIIVEMNKVAEAIGTAKSPLVVSPNNPVKKTEATELNNKQKEINNVTGKTITPINVDENIKATNIENIKKWLKEL